MSDSQQADRVHTALTIAGSDSGGGAGIQADLKAFAASGVHGLSAIVALTAQNTVGITSIHPIPAEMIIDQVRAVASDMGVDAVKIGMLGSETAIDAVVEALSYLGEIPLVLDPVMVSESGAVLLEPGARRALAERLLPLATVVTPNLAEAQVLAGREGEEPADQVELAAAVRALGPSAVIVTGGHTSRGADLLDDGSGAPFWIEGDLHPDGAAHGSGCTHSSTLAAQLALGRGLREAATIARAVAAGAVAAGLREIGAGPGPVDVLNIKSLRGRA